MSSVTMMERTGMGVPGLGYPGMGVSPYTTPGATPYVNYFSVPRCTYKFEKVADGCKIWCVCDDKSACAVLQNLCTALSGGLVSCNCTYNGVTVCRYAFTVGMCKWELCEGGVCFTCTSGDTQCKQMIQCWCDSLTCMTSAGCHCYVCVNDTPVCCGTGETSKTPTKR